MNHPDTNNLLEKALRGKLSPGEQGRFEELLEADHDLRARFEQERALDGLLDALPNAPVSSNFTARVLEAVQREERVRNVPRPSIWRRVRWGWSRIAATAAVVGIGLFANYQYQHQQRAELAQSAVIFSEMAGAMRSDPGEGEAAVVPVGVLQNFEAVSHLSYVPAAEEIDMELLVALQK